MAGPGSASLSLAYAGAQGYSFGPLFSVIFTIATPYPSVIPDQTIVEISGELMNEVGDTIPLQRIIATVSVQEPSGSVPEPAVLGLLGLALPILARTARRRSDVIR